MNDSQNTLVEEVHTTKTMNLVESREIDVQIATAHRFPRSLSGFMVDMKNMLTLNEEVAAECIYALPRGSKTIDGPSIRFAELVASAWGNCRVGAHIVGEVGNFIVSQGVFHDLQRNVAITFESRRRITDKNGMRYSDDMVAVTGNAASSIALRNAILKGVPKAFWNTLYTEARNIVVGDVQTLPNRRERIFGVFQRYGISKEQILEFFGFKGEEDIMGEHIAILQGVFNSIREGDVSPENALRKDNKGDKNSDFSMPKAKATPPSSGSPARSVVTAPSAQPATETAVAPSAAVPSTSEQADKPVTTGRGRKLQPDAVKANESGEVLATDEQKMELSQALVQVNFSFETAAAVVGIEEPLEHLKVTSFEALMNFVETERNDLLSQQ